MSSTFGTGTQQYLKDAKKKGVRIVCVDPRRTRTSAALAEQTAQGLIGPSATFPDLGALADWLGTLPKEVGRLRDVTVRRGWAYIMAKRGEDAKGPLRDALEQRGKDGVVRSYYAEALRQTGAVEAAMKE